MFEFTTLKSNLKLFYFAGTAFTSMPQLKYLDISYNHLPIVKKGAFKGGLISEGILKKSFNWRENSNGQVGEFGSYVVED